MSDWEKVGSKLIWEGTGQKPVGMEDLVRELK